MVSLASEALNLAKAGFAVFPLRENRKDPAIAGGFTNAATNHEQVEAMWNLRPHLNLGIATGGVSGGLVVIDCDYHPDEGRDGLSVKAEWEAIHGEFPRTVCVETPTGGEHYYFRSDEPFNCSTNHEKAIDIRADGGYVVAPPSIHPNGKPYVWIESYEECKVADIDDNVKAFIRSVQGSNGKHKKFELPDVIPSGGRNDTLFKLACSLQAQGSTDEEILAQLHGVNKLKCKPPMSDVEVEKIFNQAIEYKKGIKRQPENTGTKRKMPHDVFGRKLIEEDHACKVDGAPAVFDGQRYVTGWSAVERAIVRHQSGTKRQDQREICHFLDLQMEHVESAPPHLIGFLNGIWDMFGDGELIPYSPDTIITNVIPHMYNNDAYDPVVDKFLDDVSCQDKAIRANLEEVIGLCLFRSNEYGICPILLGEGSNGKSTFIDALRNVLGIENTSSLDIGILGKQFQTGRILGKLANLGDDISNEFLRGDALAVFKKVVTGDMLYSDVKGGDGFEFKPYCTLVFSANEMPNLGDYSKGMLRRLFPIPFDAYFDASQPGYDPFIGRKLKTPEAASYLCKLGVLGLQRVMAQNGMSPNSRSREMLHEVRLSNDNVAAWIEECGITRDSILNKGTTYVYRGYTDWCAQNGAKPVSSRKFGRRVAQQLHVVTVVTRNGRHVGRTYRVNPIG